MPSTLDVSLPGVGDLLSDFESLALWESMHSSEGGWAPDELSRATGFPASVVAASLGRLEALGLCTREPVIRGVPTFRAAPGPLVVTFDPSDESSNLRLATVRLGLMNHLQRMAEHHARPSAAALGRDVVATVAADPELVARLNREIARIADAASGGTSDDEPSPRASVSLSVRPVRGGLRFPVVMLIPASEVGRRADPRLASLSPRELEIASSLADGRTKKEIAERLGVSFSTVNTITSRIYRKLGVTRRASLVNAMRG